MASLAELEAEIRRGRDKTEMKERLNDFLQFLKLVPSRSFKASSMPQDPAIMIPADAQPYLADLTKDRRIRAEIAEVLDRLSRENPGKTIVVLFLTFDTGCRRLMAAVRQPDGVVFLVPRLEQDLNGPGAIDVMYGILIPFTEDFE